ncbi:MAG: hypothetical protein SFU86_25240 [Pirellulaceae bacterium]|nr:hypothetical protein [Pirellulaceae bacterium]
MILPSGAPPGSVAVDAETNSMLLSAERIQLITVGELKRGKQTVSAQFRFTEDLGDAGFFFGYREGDVGNKRVGISHLLYRQRLRDLPDGSELFRLIREQAWFPPGNAVPISFAGRTIEMAPTKSRDFELAVQFDETGIREVAFDGVPIPELLIAALNRTFDAGDLWGAWGIYNNASTVRVSQLVLNPGVKP